MTSEAPIKFPKAAEIRRAISAIAKAGVNVGVVELSPDGAIRIYSSEGDADRSKSDFDYWNERGAL